MRSFVRALVGAVVAGSTALDVESAPPELASAWRTVMAEAPTLEPATRFPFEHCFRRAAAERGVPLVLLLAVARGESDFDPRARSSANAHGLMQILWPTTARHLGIHRLSELYEPCRNVDAGARYLEELLARYARDAHRALAAYNFGPRRIPTGDGPIPAGAEWYSGYIYRHLGYVVGRGGREPPARYDNEGRLELIVFARPYRAAGFVDALARRTPDLRLDWFRRSLGLYRVYLVYKSREELEQAKQTLRHAGVPVP